MKTARKLTSLLLALLLVFALAATAAAEGADAGTTTNTGSITVDNPIAGKTYTAYKIFDVVYDDSTPKNYSYTIKGDSAWFRTVQDYANGANSGLILTPVADTTANTYVVTIDDTNGTNKFSAPSFAAALDDALARVNPPTDVHQLEDQGEEKVASSLPLGYYFVKSSENKALCNLTTTDPEVTIHDKNNVPFKKTKTVEKNDFNVGDTVTFTITGKVPDYTGFDTYTYLITDTMSEGLTYTKGSVTVMVGDADVKSACTIAENFDSNANKFTVSIPVKDYPIGANIVVTYTATINEKAVAIISNNEATLTYSDDPTNLEHKTTTPPQKVDVYTSKIAIVKVEKAADDATATPKKLEGAEFVLYKEETVEGIKTPKYYKWNDTDKQVEWVVNKAQADVKKTDKKGEASFDGLADGTYYLVETKAPAGYNQLKDPVTVTVAGSNKDDETGNLIVTQKVENQAGTLLPSTGGMGTTVFYVLGAVLVLGAGVLLVTKKRMSRNEG